NRDAKLFRSALSYYIATSVNFSLLKKEYAYEILTLGILADLDNVYYIMSEEKLPRTQSDQVLVPKEKYKDFLPAVVLEYERCNKVTDLEARALAGRRQIDEKEYDVKLKAFGFTDIYKLGVAFCGSHVVVKTEYAE
ncbi:MAG: PD-(D/E)XK nuclease domain-containing protein, partial [Clostridia bacterium]|nr:PD-(D/E)XK nuclease domain-containing protein [Clostridia bacterium]